MKKWILICFLFISGCTSLRSDFEGSLRQVIEKENSLEAFKYNHTKPLYSYYLDPSIGRIYSDETSSILTINNIKFIMNINITKVLNEKYYQVDNPINQLNQEYLLFDIKGQYKDYMKNDLDYTCSVYKIDDEYILVFESRYVNFYSQGSELELEVVLKKMVKIAKSINVEEEEIIATYSSKEAIEYKKETIELFDVMVPENGRLEDLFGIEVPTTNQEGSQPENEGSSSDENYSTDDYQN